MRIPTAHSSKSVERFLKHIKESEVPDVVSRDYLKDAGFVSGNDPELRHIFRLLGFLDHDYTPTKMWAEYKEDGRKILRKSVEECYEELFSLFPDAASRSDVELAQWFKPPVTGETVSSRQRAIRTFRKLCIYAGIAQSRTVDAAARRDSIPDDKLKMTSSVSKSPHLHLPSNATQEEFEALFRAYKKVFNGE